jgi:hypothetical protein
VVRLEKLPHPPQVLGGIASQSGEAPLDSLGSPQPIIGDLQRDVFADIPVELDQRGVDCNDRKDPCCLDQLHNYLRSSGAGFDAERVDSRLPSPGLREDDGFFVGFFVTLFSVTGIFSQVIDITG